MASCGSSAHRAGNSLLILVDGRAPESVFVTVGCVKLYVIIICMLPFDRQIVEDDD